MLDAEPVNLCEDVRYPYAACRGEGENACVIGPDGEIIVEIVDDSSPEDQMRLASHIAEGFTRRLDPRDEVDSMPDDVVRDKYRDLRRQIDALADTILKLDIRGTEDAGACAIAEARLRAAYGNGQHYCGPTCKDAAERARLFLLLVEQVGIEDPEAMQYVADALDNCGPGFAGERVEEIRNGGVPF